MINRKGRAEAIGGVMFTNCGDRLAGDQRVEALDLAPYLLTAKPPFVDDSLWPRPSLPCPRPDLPLKIRMPDASDCLQVVSRTHSPGHERKFRLTPGSGRRRSSRR